MGGVGLASPIKEEGKETSEENFQPTKKRNLWTETIKDKETKSKSLSLNDTRM